MAKRLLHYSHGADSVSQRLRGEGSLVAWRINGERLVVVGWGAAVLMQFAHPLVAAGVLEHSTVVARPDLRLRRLRGTLDVMLTLTFGTSGQAARAAARINSIHDRIHGQLREPAPSFPAGTAYDAHDPALLTWVHVTLLHVLPRAYELFVGPLSAADQDRFCIEAAETMPLLGLPAGDLPRSMIEVQAYLDCMLASGAIAVGATARQLAHDLLAPSHLDITLPLLPLVRLTTVGLLPPTLRGAYGLRWSTRDETALRLLGATTRRLLPLLPASWRYWPAARAVLRRQPAATGPQPSALR